MQELLVTAVAVNGVRRRFTLEHGADHRAAARRAAVAGAGPGTPPHVRERLRAGADGLFDDALANLVADTDDFIGIDDRASDGIVIVVHVLLPSRALPLQGLDAGARLEAVRPGGDAAQVGVDVDPNLRGVTAWANRLKARPSVKTLEG